VGDEGDQKQDQKNEEQDLRDSSRCTSDSSEAQGSSDERHDQKYESPIQHGSVSSSEAAKLDANIFRKLL
jgi:hypothetical protein